MPKNDVFMFKILLGGQPVTEYEKDGKTFVMTNLMHQTSYQEERIEFVDDREERQLISVTPYQIAITLTSEKYSEAWASVYVDGSFVKQVLLTQGRQYILKGFKDGEKIREFLFSLPRFGRDKDDRIEVQRLENVGCIFVELFEAKFSHSEMRREKRLRSDQSLDYTQATKKDAFEVTAGKYTMATTKPGRYIGELSVSEGKRKRNSQETINIWSKGKQLSKLDVKYHMRHTLVEMGIEVSE